MGNTEKTLTIEEGKGRTLSVRVAALDEISLALERMKAANLVLGDMAEEVDGVDYPTLVKAASAERLYLLVYTISNICDDLRDALAEAGYYGNEK